MNYAILLRQRAAMAQARPTEIRDYLTEYNIKCLLTWRKRWYEHRPLLDAWPANARLWFDRYLVWERMKAYVFLQSLKEQKLKDLKVAVFRKRGEK